MKKRTVIIAVVCCLLAVTVSAAVKVTLTGNYHGIYLLTGKAGSLLEVKDDLFLNEEQRYILGIDFDGGRQFLRRLFGTDPGKGPYLSFEWNTSIGDGFVSNHLPGGKQLLTYFSRFIDDSGKELSGLFVGGGLPANARAGTGAHKNETGMAFHDGTRWVHLWCNVNEAIFSVNAFEPVPPSAWRYRESDVLHAERTDLILESVHEVAIDGVPLRIDRYAHFRAGEPYFILSIYITNIGDRPATYSYQYGDEPWLGDYGSSEGNVGWAADGLHQFVGTLDTDKQHYAGMFDYGNQAIGERHDYTLVANFIEWFGEERPMAYFTNGPSESPRTNGRKVPLSGNTRFFGLLWGPRTVQPDQTVNYTLAIGMADRDPRTGFPVKPLVDLKLFP